MIVTLGKPHTRQEKFIISYLCTAKYYTYESEDCKQVGLADTRIRDREVGRDGFEG